MTEAWTKMLHQTDALVTTLASAKLLGRDGPTFVHLTPFLLSDLAHDLFPGAILIFLQALLCGHRVKMAATLKKYSCLSTHWDSGWECNKGSWVL